MSALTRDTFCKTATCRRVERATFIGWAFFWITCVEGALAQSSAVGRRKSGSLLKGFRTDAVRWYAASSVPIKLVEEVGPLTFEEKGRHPFDPTTASIPQQGPPTSSGLRMSERNSVMSLRRSNWSSSCAVKWIGASSSAVKRKSPWAARKGRSLIYGGHGQPRILGIQQDGDRQGRHLTIAGGKTGETRKECQFIIDFALGLPLCPTPLFTAKSALQGLP